MKKRPLVGFAAALVLFAGAVGTVDRSIAQGVTDATITANVQAQFAAHQVLKASQITVTADHGVVRLSGTARSLAAKDEARDVAVRVPGVKSVNNDIAIDEVSDSAIMAEIKTGFDTNGVTKAAHITVTSVQGVVTLTGTANSPAAKDEARDVARKAHGVRNVVNNVVAHP